jgi:hypothetical protein
VPGGGFAAAPRGSYINGQADGRDYRGAPDGKNGLA